MTSFINRLDHACETSRSLVCVGLDVDPQRMPVKDPLEFNQAIVDATADLVCAYKPNLAFYEALGIPGLQALEGTIDYIRSNAPQTIIIGDAKRGDIGPSGEAYTRAMFEVWGFDAVTFNAWGGQDTLLPFVKDPNRGIFIWCRGSNPSAADFQDLPVDTAQGRVPLYQHLARAAVSWNHNGNIGLVMGATYPKQLADIREMCPDMPLLVPGVGTQGGDLEAAVRAGVDSHGRRAIINSSRGIIYASDGPGFAQAARQVTGNLRDAINRVLEAEGKGWP